jgi:hypothetical protein
MHYVVSHFFARLTKSAKEQIELESIHSFDGRTKQYTRNGRMTRVQADFYTNMYCRFHCETKINKIYFAISFLISSSS